jgi:hypothetical protein
MGIRIETIRQFLIVGSLAFCGLAGSDAHAQAQGHKPFEDIYRRPNVSPYNQIAAYANSPLQAQNVYQQQVKPLVEQQQQRIEQMSQRRDMGRLQGQVNQIQGDSRSRQIDSTIRPTGHASTYQNYSHYYQQRR